MHVEALLCPLQEVRCLVCHAVYELPQEHRDFRELVSADSEIRSRLNENALAEAFDLSVALRHVDVLFERLAALAEKTRERKEEAVHA